MNELSTNHMRFSREQGKVWITDVSFYAEHPRVVERLPLPSGCPNCWRSVWRRRAWRGRASAWRAAVRR